MLIRSVWEQRFYTCASTVCFEKRNIDEEEDQQSLVQPAIAYRNKIVPSSGTTALPKGFEQNLCLPVQLLSGRR